MVLLKVKPQGFILCIVVSWLFKPCFIHIITLYKIMPQRQQGWLCRRHDPPRPAAINEVTRLARSLLCRSCYSSITILLISAVTLLYRWYYWKKTPRPGPTRAQRCSAGKKKPPKTNRRSLEHIKIHITAFTDSSGVKRSGWVIGRPADSLRCGLMAAHVDACPLIAIWQQHNQRLTEVYDATVCGQTQTEHLSQARAKCESWTDPVFSVKMLRLAIQPPLISHAALRRSACFYTQGKVATCGGRAVSAPRIKSQKFSYRKQNLPLI